MSIFDGDGIEFFFPRYRVQPEVLDFPMGLAAFELESEVDVVDECGYCEGEPDGDAFGWASLFD